MKFMAAKRQNGELKKVDIFKKKNEISGFTA
jgi:hypothetical protein